jgi:hypothetical protein
MRLAIPDAKVTTIPCVLSPIANHALAANVVTAAVADQAAAIFRFIVSARPCDPTGSGTASLILLGTSKNRRYSCDATKLPTNDSASFPFRFIDVHAGAARDRYREQFFEVPF